MTKFDDCGEAVNLLNNVKGSIENKIRTAYNLGYKQGLKAEQTEPQKWDAPPKFEHKGIITTCVSVPMALIEDKRCAECRHWSYGKDICNLHDMGMMAEDYCSYWERK